MSPPHTPNAEPGKTWFKRVGISSRLELGLVLGMAPIRADPREEPLVDGAAVTLHCHVFRPVRAQAICHTPGPRMGLAGIAAWPGVPLTAVFPPTEPTPHEDVLDSPYSCLLYTSPSPRDS
eukprot:TRINITY_DN11317_c0_g1_i4.p1 TRINITY_DN11317_c0_g1~~TRINITY_DN11317_c0_g1_i4.p1  ORF type:complete len:121 (-),score=4.18 TRINITY_DN11317_c0_g1_i4:154-516(-)